jgi:hypothetical protein
LEAVIVKASVRQTGNPSIRRSLVANFPVLTDAGSGRENDALHPRAAFPGRTPAVLTSHKTGLQGRIMRAADAR